jgi:alkanesulfonate monooxygenase SsuD/methylene tetrahydromethanopterin reductase-like flavin-dependent oxidoreductase (luciferase family)
MLSVGIGLYTGQRPTGAAGPAYRDAVPLAAAAERAGFDSFWVSEHHGWADDYLPSPLTLLGAVAAATERLELGTAVVLAPLHHPLRLAEDAAVVDHLSGGRLLLGLGLGYVDDEYALFGIRRAERVRRLEAAIAAVRNGAVTPRPLAAGRPPLYLGGYAPAAVGRAAALADGHIVGRGEPPIIDSASAQLASTDRASFVRVVVVTCVLDDDGGDPDSARAAFTRQQLAYEHVQAGRSVYGGLVDDPAGSVGLASGSIDAYIQVAGSAPAVVDGLTEVVRRLDGWRRRHLVVRLLYPGEELDAQLERIAAFGTSVLSPLRAMVGRWGSDEASE